MQQIDISYGLNKDMVHQRMEAGLYNKKVESATKSVKDIFKENILTYFNLIFTILGILLALVGSFNDMLFLLVIIANTTIGIVQEIHSKKVLDRLSILNAPKTKVIREGVVKEIPSEKLVQDDIVIFEAGNQIPADAVVMSGMVTVNEALITGEPDEIKKEEGSQLLSGSFIIAGQATAQIRKVGEESYISQLTLQATKSKEGEQSEMIRSLNYLILVMGIMIIPIGIALFAQSYFFNESGMKDSVTSMVAAVIGMIPEGLYLLTSVALAVSTVRLASQKVLIHDMKCIEALARVNVLCVDKTGTITEPGMKVYEFSSLMDNKDELYSVISSYVGAMKSDNETMKALQEYFVDGVLYRPEQLMPFSSKTKYSAVTMNGKNYYLGAPELILKDNLQILENKISEYASKGYRVLLFAEGEHFPGEEGVISGEMKPLGLIMLANPIRNGAKETFAYFKDNHVTVKVISGDNPVTVSAIAVEAGIEGAERYIDATTLRTREEVMNAVMEYNVFGRVTPNQKKLLVQAIKAQKMTVAMTGDGVNDVLALKEADCSVAMASGSEAAANVSQLVLLDSDFSRMPSVVMEGRQVVNNIERSAALYIVKNIFSMLLAIFSVLLVWDYPLEPTQVSLISMFTIGIPSFVLALEPNHDIIRGRFLVNILVKALPAGLTDFLVVSGLVLFCREFDVALDCLSTSCTILVAIVGFMILYRIAKPMNKLHVGMMIGVIAGWLFCMINISHFFAITSLSKHVAMLMIVFALITEPCLRYLSAGVEGLQNLIQKMNAKRKK